MTGAISDDRPQPVHHGVPTVARTPHGPPQQVYIKRATKTWTPQRRARARLERMLETATPSSHAYLWKHGNILFRWQPAGGGAGVFGAGCLQVVCAAGRPFGAAGAPPGRVGKFLSNLVGGGSTVTPSRGPKLLEVGSFPTTSAGLLLPFVLFEQGIWSGDRATGQWKGWRGEGVRGKGVEPETRT